MATKISVFVWCSVIFLILVIVGISLNTINIRSQQERHNILVNSYNNLVLQHQELVDRLASNLPGGAYIVEPLPEEPQLSEVDIQRLFGNN